MEAVNKFTPRYRAETAQNILNHWDDFVQNDVSAYEADWVQAVRNRGQAKLSNQGLPTQKLERFKYVNIPSWLKKNEIAYKKADIKGDGHTLCLRDLSEHLKQPPQWLRKMIELSPVSEDKYGDMMLWHLSNAYLQDGVTIDVPANIRSEKPLNITYTGHDGGFTNTHNIIRLDENTDFILIEYHMGSGAYFNNALTHIKLGKNSRLRHYRFQENDQKSLFIQNTYVEIEQDAHYETFTLTNGAGLSRNQIHVDLIGTQSQCHLNGINLLENKQIADTTITVEHQAPSCISKQNYRNVLNDQAVGTFQGKVHVHQIAQKTDGYQKSDSLLLSKQATMNTKPELEIYADDVKCSHGTVTGMIDENAMFYLQSRGIPEEQARALLIEAFASQATKEINYDPILEQVSLIVHKWLETDISTPNTEDSNWLKD